MSRVFEALQQLNAGAIDPASEPDPLTDSPSVLAALGTDFAEFDSVREFRVPAVSSSRLIALSEPHTLAAEKLRGLAAHLRKMGARRSGNRLLMASAVRGDGKSMMSANLAITLATQGERTLLIDGDLHKPTLHPLLGVRERRGFTNWTDQRSSLADYLWRESSMPLWFLPAGDAVDQPLTKIQLPATSGLLSKLANSFEWIIVDSPPVMPLADSGVWSSMCDWVLLVVREGFTPKAALAKTVDVIDRTKLCVTILNDAVSSESKYYRQYYTRNTEGTGAKAGK